MGTLAPEVMGPAPPSSQWHLLVLYPKDIPCTLGREWRGQRGHSTWAQGDQLCVWVIPPEVLTCVLHSVAGPVPCSHIVKLSHTVRQPGNEGEAIQFEDLAEAAAGKHGERGGPASPPEMEEQYIVRPEYRKGREIVVYRDANHMHSAPDYAYRESLWRFM